MNQPAALDVRNGQWVHAPERGDDSDQRSEQQITVDHFLRDLALAIHYERTARSRDENIPSVGENAGPRLSEANHYATQIAALTGEANLRFGEEAAAEILAAATHLADTKPGQ